MLVAKFSFSVQNTQWPNHTLLPNLTCCSTLISLRKLTYMKNLLSGNRQLSGHSSFNFKIVFKAVKRSSKAIKVWGKMSFKFQQSNIGHSSRKKCQSWQFTEEKSKNGCLKTKKSRNWTFTKKHEWAPHCQIFRSVFAKNCLTDAISATFIFQVRRLLSTGSNGCRETL